MVVPVYTVRIATCLLPGLVKAMQAYRLWAAIRTHYLHRSSEQPMEIVVTSEASLKLHLTNQVLICVGATNMR